MQTIYSIPSYADLSAEDKSSVDVITSKLDWKIPGSMQTLGQDACAALEDTTTRIITVMKHQPGSVFTSAMEGFMKKMEDANLSDITEDVKRAASKGLNAAAKNKELVVAGVGFMTGNIFVGGIAGALGLKKFIDRKRRDPMSMDAIEERIGNALGTIEQGVAELRLSQRRAPEVIATVNNLHTANSESFQDTTLCIVAGREYRTQLTGEIIPGLAADAKSKPTFESDELLRTAETSLKRLDARLILLETLRAESANSSIILRDIAEAISTSQESVESLLTNEVPSWQRDLIMAGVAVDTHKVVTTAEKFRDQIESMRDDSAKAAQHALQSAQSGRLASPERMQRVLERTENLRTSFIEHAKTIRESDEQTRVLQGRIENATTSLMQTVSEGLTANQLTSDTSSRPLLSGGPEPKV